MTGQSPQVRVLRPTWQAPTNIVALTTTRAGGYSPDSFKGLNLAYHVGDDPTLVQKNRNLLAERLKSVVNFQWLNQVHGVRVAAAQRNDVLVTADATFTTEPGLACCVLTADCLPVFLASKKGDAVAMVHAGWRGLAAGILEETMQCFPVAAEETVAWLGPAIGACHFQVGQDVRDAFLAKAGPEPGEELAACFSQDPLPGKYLADLYKLASVKLNRLGLVSVGGGGHCTFCQNNDFYSFRRQNQTGRMASLIYLKV